MKRKEAVKLAPQTKRVRCIYSTRLVVDKPFLAKRYVFEPGQHQEVLAIDAAHLLTLERNQDGACCHGPGQPIKYFEKVP